MVIIPLLIAWFVFWFVVNVIKTTATNALMIAVIVFLIYISYGITPEQILDFLVHLPDYIVSLFTNNPTTTAK